MSLQKINIILGLQLLFIVQMMSQDIHWSQFYNSPLNLSPALTGIQSGDIRFQVNYKNQWNTVPVGYNTMSASYDGKYYTPNLKNSMFGVGMIFNYDKSGYSKLEQQNIQFLGSITHRIGENHFLTGGIDVGFTQRAFDFSDLSFTNQWDGDVYNPKSLTREPNDATEAKYADFSLGINYHFQLPKKRTKIDFGVGLFHINEPEGNSFWADNTVFLSQRTSFYGLVTVYVAPKFDILGSVSFQYQSGHKEQLYSLAARYHLSQEKTKELALQVGGIFRNKDAFAPALEIHYKKQWQVAFTYDINFSPFKITTEKIGGPEFSLSYIITKPRFNKVKFCPIY